MGRKRKPSDAWMPERVYRGRSAYEWKPRGGGTIRLGPLTMSRAELFAAYEKAQHDEVFTLSDLATKYFRSHQYHDLSPVTRKDYSDAWKQLEPAMGEAKPHEVTQVLVREYMDARSSKTRANRERSLLRTIFKWGIERGYAEKDPTEGVRTFKEAARTRYVSDEEYDAVYKLAPPTVQIAMEIAYLCAAREADVLRLKWSDVRENGIFIRQGKTNKAQVKLWTKRLRDVIDQARALRKEAEAAREAKGKVVTSIYVIQARSGQKYTESGFKAVWRKVLLKWLGEDADTNHPQWFTFHDLKAKSITDYEGDKQRFSGHSSKRVMERHYNRKPDEVRALNPKKKA